MLTVSIRYILDARELRVAIEDSGIGFEWQTLTTQTLETVHAFTGRGILLARMAFDEVEYNSAGNAVTLTKRRSRGNAQHLQSAPCAELRSEGQTLGRGARGSW